MNPQLYQRVQAALRPESEWPTDARVLIADLTRAIFGVEQGREHSRDYIARLEDDLASVAIEAAQPAYREGFLDGVESLAFCNGAGERFVGGAGSPPVKLADVLARPEEQDTWAKRFGTSVGESQPAAFPRLHVAGSIDAEGRVEMKSTHEAQP